MAGLYAIQDIKAAKWVDNNVHLDNLEMIKDFRKINGVTDEFNDIIVDLFLNRVHKHPLNFKKRLISHILYWKEVEKPKIRFAPEGLGEIDWVYRLDVKERQHGVMHIGIDLKTRRFICYEYTIGVYYPQGFKLERIRAEILQSKDRPLNIGKHWLKNNKPRKGINRINKPDAPETQRRKSKAKQRGQQNKSVNCEFQD